MDAYESIIGYSKTILEMTINHFISQEHWRYFYNFLKFDI